MKNIDTDVLVIGGGSAATRAAIEAAKAGVKTLLVDKGVVSESGSSPRALVGFSAKVTDEDSDELYLQDWIKASGGICDQNLVMEVIRQGPNMARELEAIGIKWISNPDNSWFIAQRAGHSIKRTLQAKGVGHEHSNVITMLRAEAEKQCVNFCEGVMITRLLKKDDRVVGAYGINNKGEHIVFRAKAVVLAAGGANRMYPCLADGIELYKYRTTGDSFNLAFHAGAPIVDMEFTQFRDSPPAGPIYNAHYLNSLGERYMERYDPVALEKAPRAMMVRALYNEVLEGRGPIVWKVEENQVARSRAPMGHKYATGQIVEIVLQYQRLMGGARIDTNATTAVPGLFAAGESAGGLQGGDRMQGHGFPETQVFGGIAGRSAAALAKDSSLISPDQTQIEKEQNRLAHIGGDQDPAEFIRTVQNIMWEQASVVTNKGMLQQAIDKLQKLRKETSLRLSNTDIFAALEAANLVLAAEMVAQSKLAREETRSAHSRNDFPLADDNWIKHVCITNKAGDIEISTIPVNTQYKQ
ncbi:MAG: FAD-dependent oxidoreductase [Steroidobacteraceae bacterium]